jgi:Zn-dependent protease with chaperone function
VLSLLGQAILHALIAAAVIEALLRVWRIEDAGTRLVLRAIALTLPVLVVPLYEVLAPFRLAPWFAERWALFSMARWSQLRVHGAGVDSAAILALALLGVLLFLFDLLPALRTWLVDRALPHAGDPAMLARLTAEAARLGAGAARRAPRIRLVDGDAPVLLCSGLRDARLVVSTGALATLDAAQLRAALAHELAHAAHRDPLVSWGLMAVRSIFFFSPATQFVARSIVDELERRADEESAAVAGDRLAMAGALIRLFTAAPKGEPASMRPGASYRGRIARWLHLGRSAAIERRCRRLLAPPPGLPARFWPLQAALAGLSLAVLLFFVV